MCAGLGLALFTSSCGDDYDAYPTVPGKDTMRNPMLGDFKATVDGVEFIADSKYISDVTTDGVRSVVITGVMDSYNKNPKSNTTITLNITHYEGPNTYPIGWNNIATLIKLEDGVTRVYKAKAEGDESYISISADADRLQGSFKFTVAPDGVGNVDTIPITSGEFNIPK